MGIKLDTSKVAPTMRIFDMPERVIKIPFSQNATEKLTGITLQSGMWITDVFVQVTTAVGGSSIDVGLNAASGIFDNPDGLVNGLACTATGWFHRDTMVSPLLPGHFGGNYVNTSAGLARGTTPQKIKSVNAISYMINGVMYTKTGTDDLFTLTGLDTTGSTKFNGAFLYLDTSGAASIVAGTEGLSAAAIVWPDPVVASKCCIGSIVVNDEGGAFTGGTTSLADCETEIYTNAVSGTNDEVFGLGPIKGMQTGHGLRLTADAEISYTTSAHAVAGWIYVVVRGGFE